MPWIQDTHPERNDMPVFNDSNNILPLLPDGDYIFEVSDFECKLSKGAKTSGSDKYELELTFETGNRVYESLIDHPSCAWKIDTFLKSAGVKMAKGESFDFREDLARANGVRWVDPIGLRGWCRVGSIELPPKDGRPALNVNTITTFYTDKPKIEANEERKPF